MVAFKIGKANLIDIIIISDKLQVKTQNSNFFGIFRGKVIAGIGLGIGIKEDDCWEEKNHQKNHYLKKMVEGQIYFRIQIKN